MKTMAEYLHVAQEILGIIADYPKTVEIRNYIKTNLSDWTGEERDELVVLCCKMSLREFDAANRALWHVNDISVQKLREAEKITKVFHQHKMREGDKHDRKQRCIFIEQHFGAALRCELPIDDTEDDA